MIRTYSQMSPSQKNAQKVSLGDLNYMMNNKQKVNEVP